jgi:hypothetical protein
MLYDIHAVVAIVPPVKCLLAARRFEALQGKLQGARLQRDRQARSNKATRIVPVCRQRVTETPRAGRPSRNVCAPLISNGSNVEMSIFAHSFLLSYA